MADIREFWRLVRKPLLTWLALCLLLTATCALAFVPMGAANLPVSLAIAALKATLVGAVFMRLTEPNTLNRLTAFVGPVWIVVMALLMGSDYFTR